jgi:hypothetical protein
MEESEKETKYGIYCTEKEAWVTYIRESYLSLSKNPTYSQLASYDAAASAKAWLTKCMKPNTYAGKATISTESKTGSERSKNLDAADFARIVLSCEVREIKISFSVGETVFKKIFKPQ